MNITSTDKITEGLRLRTHAIALLQQAQEIDGLRPFSVTHNHRHGSSTYMLWAHELPRNEDAALVTQGEYDGESNETLDIETYFDLEEICGVSVTSRLPALLESQHGDVGP